MPPITVLPCSLLQLQTCNTALGAGKQPFILTLAQRQPGMVVKESNSRAVQWEIVALRQGADVPSPSRVLLHDKGFIQESHLLKHWDGHALWTDQTQRPGGYDVSQVFPASHAMRRNPSVNLAHLVQAFDVCEGCLV